MSRSGCSALRGVNPKHKKKETKKSAIKNSAENKKIACTSQLIVTTLMQVVKLPTTTATRLPSPFDEN